MITATIAKENGMDVLTLKLPLCTPPKQTEKMKLIASSGGWTETPLTFEGKTIKVNVMAGFKSAPPAGWINPKTA